ncbi:hypothetical protein [Streptomyces sp. NPDC048224]|uniref:hypothetical protein n=1 Tax=Streptomyces sp. NPDC048224 TaxID=3154500 RepID=UPI0033C05D93
MDQTTTPYHWAMTLQTARGHQASTDGVFNVASGMTRMDCFAEIQKHVREHFGFGDMPAVVLYFSFEPNVLGA